jgi:hypothetical protein
MANSNDINYILEMLVVAYPNAKIDPKTPDVYEMLLGNLDGHLLRQAASEHIQSSKWFPTIAELVTVVHELEMNRPTPPKLQSSRIYSLEDLAVQGQYNAIDWETFAVELDKAGRANMAAAVRRRSEYYASV